MAKLGGACICLGVLALLCLIFQAEAQLNTSFYDQSCPNLQSIVKQQVQQAVAREGRMAASLLRLHFHDCFVMGCDASILLAGSMGEQGATPNNNSIRGLDVINTIKSAVESSCRGVVSCADILALSARESVILLGGPSWTVNLGRRDSLTSSANAANQQIPAPTLTASQLVSNFQNQQLTPQDLVALSGGHTVGQAQCRNFRARLYNASSGPIDPSYQRALQQICPSSGNDTNLAPLDPQTPLTFDNLYFQNLQMLRGLLFSDQQLYSGNVSSLPPSVNTFASNQQAFFTAFANAATKLANLNALTGSQGEIRTNCSRTNSGSS